ATGYLTNPYATSECTEFPYSVADEYLRAMDIPIGEKWKYFGAFGAMAMMNGCCCTFSSTLCGSVGRRLVWSRCLGGLDSALIFGGWVVTKVMKK
ncbi:hypothetical protein B9Z19DRAFT_1152860, partial [Tuber borchii]